MTNEERCIRFETALDIVRNVYSDYCKDESKTREQSKEFCYFVIDMAKQLAILRAEAKKQKEKSNEQTQET